MEKEKDSSDGEERMLQRRTKEAQEYQDEVQKRDILARQQEEEKPSRTKPRMQGKQEDHAAGWASASEQEAERRAREAVLIFLEDERRKFDADSESKSPGKYSSNQNLKLPHMSDGRSSSAVSGPAMARRRNSVSIHHSDSKQATSSATKANAIPAGAKWTKIDRKLVDPEALDAAKERYEERQDCVVVLRVLSRDEIEELARKTKEIRNARGKSLSELSAKFSLPSPVSSQCLHSKEADTKPKNRHLSSASERTANWRPPSVVTDESDNSLSDRETRAIRRTSRSRKDPASITLKDSGEIVIDLRDRSRERYRDRDQDRDLEQYRILPSRPRRSSTVEINSRSRPRPQSYYRDDSSVFPPPPPPPPSFHPITLPGFDAPYSSRISDRDRRRPQSDYGYRSDYPDSRRFVTYTPYGASPSSAGSPYDYPHDMYPRSSGQDYPGYRSSRHSVVSSRASTASYISSRASSVYQPGGYRNDEVFDLPYRTELNPPEQYGYPSIYKNRLMPPPPPPGKTQSAEASQVAIHIPLPRGFDKILCGYRNSNINAVAMEHWVSVQYLSSENAQTEKDSVQALPKEVENSETHSGNAGEVVITGRGAGVEAARRDVLNLIKWTAEIVSEQFGQVATKPEAHLDPKDNVLPSEASKAGNISESAPSDSEKLGPEAETLQGEYAEAKRVDKSLVEELEPAALEETSVLGKLQENDTTSSLAVSGINMDSSPEDNGSITSNTSVSEESGDDSTSWQSFEETLGESGTGLEVDTDVEKDEMNTSPDERFVNPKEWREKLERLEAEIAGNSTFLLESEKDNKAASGSDVVLSDQLRSKYGRIRTSVNLLKASGYCSDTIPLLILYPERPNVAIVRTLDVGDVELEKVSVGITSEEFCESYLSTLGFTAKPNLPMSEVLIQLLDLVVLSYAGAHLEPFNEKYMSTPVDEIECGNAFVMRRRRTKCLDAYLNKREVWVFELSGAAKDIGHQDALYISTRVEDFNNLWGPVWKSSLPNDGPIIRYNVGFGSIIPWTRAESEPEPQNDETFCHWTNDPTVIEASDGSVVPVAGSNGQTPFKSRLLIGGMLSINMDCTHDINKFTTEMRDKNRLHPIGTHTTTHELDTTAVGGQFSGFGVAVNYLEEYKRRSAPFRDEFLAAWANEPQRRNLNTLRHFFAVEISACTGNARRIRLAQALGSPAIQNHLASLSQPFKWPEPHCESEYFAALSAGDVGKLKNHYAHDEKCRKTCLKAISESILVLLKTGLNQNNLLTALWVPDTTDTHVVTFDEWSYGWTGLTKEGDDDLTVAVLSNVCLELEHSQRMPALICNSKGVPSSGGTILETYLVINKGLHRESKPKGLRLRSEEKEQRYHQRWSVRSISKGATFDLGDKGRLEVIDLIRPDPKLKTGSGLVANWRDLSTTRFKDLRHLAREVVGRTPVRPSHHELVWELSADKTRPILVHVVSRSDLAK